METITSYINQYKPEVKVIPQLVYVIELVNFLCFKYTLHKDSICSM